MCIYCSTTNYRKIYESHFGSIPTEDNGRKYHIHHIDGNHFNNDPTNLKAVTIQEHYDIHYSQGDWVACHRLAAIMQHSPEEISELARKNANEQVKNGKHPWQGGEHQKRLAKRLIEDGSHHWTTEQHAESIRKREKEKVENGTHPFSGAENNKRLLAQGKHPSQNPEHCAYMSKIQTEYNKARVKEGIHPFQKLNASPWVCELCGKEGKNLSNFDRHRNSKVCIKNRRR